MLELDFSDLKLINYCSHKPKDIPFNDAVTSALKIVCTGSMQKKFKRYYIDGDSLKRAIAKRHSRAFIEALFAKKVHLCEGANDELFVNAALQQFGEFYDDYAIFKVWGKSNLPVFIELFSKMDIDVMAFFDVDNETKSPHKDLNAILGSYRPMCHVVEFDPNLEKALEYEGNKDDALGFIDHLEDRGIPTAFKLKK